MKFKKKNTNNLSTVITFDHLNKKIFVYGKLDGANAKDTINICRLLNSLNDKNSLEFYDITKIICSKDSLISEIKSIGFYIHDAIEEEKETAILLNSRILSEIEMQKLLQRDQFTFKANIIKRYIDIPNFDIHKCFACEYNLESNFIGAHIYRYCDIKNDFNNGLINAEKAAHLIVSGDNGFLLCGTQDKEFENGQIIFDINLKKFIPNKNKLTVSEIKTIENNLHSSNFENVIFSDEFKNNIAKHIERIQ